MDNDKVIQFVAGILSALTIYILLSGIVSYAGIPVFRSKEHDPRIGLSSVPEGLLSGVYRLYGQQLGWKNYDDFYHSVKNSVSVDYIDDLSDYIYETDFKDKMSREEFDERSGYRKWRKDILPGRLSSISGASQERALDLGSRGYDLASKLASAEKSKKLEGKAESMREADRGYEPYSTWDDVKRAPAKNFFPHAAEAIGASAADIIIAAIGGAAALVVLIIIPEYWNMASDKN